MNLEQIKKFVALLPEGEKKAKILQKLRSMQKSEGKSGLHDEFTFSPTGAIKIEAINDQGEVVNTLLEQSNLVVKGAEEILLRAFSGSTERILYKNRVPKNNTTKTFYIPLNETVGGKIIDRIGEEPQLLISPATLFKYVDDSEFAVEYSYIPQPMFVMEGVGVGGTAQPGMVAFKFVKYPVRIDSSGVPMSTVYLDLVARVHEVYSGHTAMFIGMGDGRHRSVALTDARLTYSTKWTEDAGKKIAVDLNESILFEEKISNFVLKYEKSDKGGKIEVKVNGVTKETIDTYDIAATTPVEASKEFKGFDHTVSTKVEFVFVGADAAITAPQVVITGLAMDALHVSDTSLMHEFESFNNRFDTPTSYNTTTIAPYTVKLQKESINPDTLVVEYDGSLLTKVATLEEVGEGTFYIDPTTEILTFDRALTNLMITFETTGILKEVKNISVLSASSQNGTPCKMHTVTYKPTADTMKVMVNGGTAEFTRANTTAEFGNGKFFVEEVSKKIYVANNDASGVAITGDIIFTYKSPERPGYPTGYTRKVIEKPKAGMNYPWFHLDKGTVDFVAEFPEKMMHDVVTIRELGLFDGPRESDNIKGYNSYPVDTFSLIRVGEIRKDVDTGLRVTWSITLLNKDGEPFTGGF